MHVGLAHGRAPADDLGARGSAKPAAMALMLGKKQEEKKRNEKDAEILERARDFERRLRKRLRDREARRAEYFELQQKALDARQAVEKAKNPDELKKAKEQFDKAEAARVAKWEALILRGEAF